MPHLLVNNIRTMPSIDYLHAGLLENLHNALKWDFIKTSMTSEKALGRSRKRKEDTLTNFQWTRWILNIMFFKPHASNALWRIVAVFGEDLTLGSIVSNTKRSK